MSWSVDDPPEVHAVEPFTDPKSKFPVFCASSKSIQDVCLFPDTLLENPKVAAALHNILAYITPEESGFDDESETNVGTQMLRAIQLSGAIDCAVIMSHWFGGTLLHGDRFRIINNLALALLHAHGHLPNRTQSNKKPRRGPRSAGSPASGQVCVHWAQRVNIGLPSFHRLHVCLHFAAKFFSEIFDEVLTELLNYLITCRSSLCLVGLSQSSELVCFDAAESATSRKLAKSTS
jgi:hypothetical protein